MRYSWAIRKVIQICIIAAIVLYLIVIINQNSTRTINGSVSHSLENSSVHLVNKKRSDLLRYDLLSINLDDLFIAVKTSSQNHQSRLSIIIKTWFELAKAQTWFITDSEDESLQRQTYGHLINTGCPPTHRRKALCCKMSVEFDAFIASQKRWFCHFDDDNYVNVPALLRHLRQYPPRQDWYLGKPSLKTALQINSRYTPMKKVSFWFATGGAGFCISRALALKMMPFASGGKLISTGEKIRLPDDVTIGYIIEHLLGTSLTIIDKFHSHLEPQRYLPKETLHDQISFGYMHEKHGWNVLNVDGFDTKTDPTRFLSLHCHLFPLASLCVQ